MKTAPSRSPSRRSSPPPPPRMTRRSPGFRRGRSPERRRRADSSGGSRITPPRSRERREFRQSPRSQPPADFPVPRRSGSPIRESKRRSFSPKRKSPKRERERRDPERERSSRPVSRKRSRSKTPPVVGLPIREGGSRLGSYSGPPEGPSQSRVYQGTDSYNTSEPVDVEHTGRSISSVGDRFPVLSRGSYEDSRNDRPVFRELDGTVYETSEVKKITVDVRNDRAVFQGPDGSAHDINELKKIKLSIPNIPLSQQRSAERKVIDPGDVIVVRRYDTSLDGEYTSERSRRLTHDHYIEHRSPSPKSRRRRSPWDQDDANSLTHRRIKSEGSRPIFDRDEIIQASERSKYEPGPSHEHRSISTDEHQRVVAIFSNPPRTQTSGGPRYESPVRYSSSLAAGSYFTDRDRDRSSSREYTRPRDYDRSHGSSFEQREKSRDDHYERRDDLRHDLELRRRDDSRYSHGEIRSYEKGRDYRGDSERGSDLRMRIHEKRTDRHDDRDIGHHLMERHAPDRERERRMIQPSPPGDRRRGPMDGGYGHMGGDRKMRGEMRMHSNTRGGPGGRRNDMSERFHPDGDFVPRTERFHGSKPWDANPEYVPKGRAYFEHDNRDEMRMPNRGRGMLGPRGYMRGRGMMRGRPFRGSGQTRGYMGGRGTGRRGGYSPRGYYNVY